MLQDERSIGRERGRERGRHLWVRFARATFLRFGRGGWFRAQLLLDVGFSVLRYAAPGSECAEADAEVDEQA
jgi:hypothetical protein